MQNIVVVGAGNAGISLAARIVRLGAERVTLVDERQVHRYRPLLNYVGGGQASLARLLRPMRAVVPPGCDWVEDSVVAVDPEASTVRTRGGRELPYDTLVLCPGLVEDWDSAPGLEAAYDEGWAASTFVDRSADRVWPALRDLRRGSVVFTVPPEPAPCAATALKPLFLACDHWRRTGSAADVRVRLVLPGSAVTGVDKADERLERGLASYGVEVLRDARVTGADPGARSLSVETAGGTRTLEGLDFAHAVPSYRAPGWLAESGLAGESAAGLVDIDPETMRHRRYDSIWSLGDVADVRTRPSGGALRHQVDVLADNLVAARDGGDLRRYDGYTVMPITLGRHRLMLVEVDRSGRAAPSVPLVDPARPRRLTWWFDRYVLPVQYFRRILRGKV